jgi:diketogulonate reductase-like aldo/keto reductase
MDVAISFRATAELRNVGLVEHLRVSNYTRRQLERVRDAVAVTLVCDQVVYLPYNDQSEVLEYCQRHNIARTACRPIARGGVLDDTLAPIGDRDDTTPAQVALRWLVYQEYLLAIPKATSSEHLAANAAVFDVELTAEEMRRSPTPRPGCRPCCTISIRR